MSTKLLLFCSWYYRYYYLSSHPEAFGAPFSSIIMPVLTKYSPSRRPTTFRPSSGPSVLEVPDPRDFVATPAEAVRSRPRTHASSPSLLRRYVPGGRKEPNKRHRYVLVPARWSTDRPTDGIDPCRCHAQNAKKKSRGKDQPTCLPGGTERTEIDRSARTERKQLTAGKREKERRVAIRSRNPARNGRRPYSASSSDPTSSS